MADSLIAGIALEQNSILIIRNLKSFQRAPGFILSEQYPKIKEISGKIATLFSPRSPSPDITGNWQLAKAI